MDGGSAAPSDWGPHIVEICEIFPGSILPQNIVVFGVPEDIVNVYVGVRKNKILVCPMKENRPNKMGSENVKNTAMPQWKVVSETDKNNQFSFSCPNFKKRSF